MIIRRNLVVVLVAVIARWWWWWRWNKQKKKNVLWVQVHQWMHVKKWGYCLILESCFWKFWWQSSIINKLQHV